MNRRIRSTCHSSRRIIRLVGDGATFGSRRRTSIARRARGGCASSASASAALPMKLVNVDYSFDGRKAVFYFTAENRVDFRDLVRDLANTLRVRVEMKQIGARDETKVTGGLGPMRARAMLLVVAARFRSGHGQDGARAGAGAQSLAAGRDVRAAEMLPALRVRDLRRTQARTARNRQACAIGQGRRQGDAPKHSQADRADSARGRRRRGRGDAAKTWSIDAPAGTARGPTRFAVRTNRWPDRVASYTTAIFYCNGPPHVGSAYEAFAADVFARTIGARAAGRTSVSSAAPTSMATRIRRAAHAEGLRPRPTPIEIARCFTKASPVSTSASTTSCAPPTRRIEKFVQQMLAARVRQRQYRTQGLRGPLLRRLRALLHREGIAARKGLPRRITRRSS